MKKTYYTKAQIDEFLVEHVLKGDRGDGIPNVLSPDNSFIEKVRQKKLTAKRIEELSPLLAADCDQETKQRIQRNLTLIDLRCIPDHISKQVLVEYEKEAGKTRNKMFNYFVKYKLKNLLDSIGEY